MKTFIVIVALFVISASNLFAQDQNSDSNFEFKSGVIFEGQSSPSTPAEKPFLFSGYYEDGVYKFVTTTKNAEVKAYIYDAENDKYTCVDSYFPKPGEKTKVLTYSYDIKDLYFRMIAPGTGFERTNNIYWAKVTSSETTKK
jgi:hypothetical protein